MKNYTEEKSKLKAEYKGKLKTLLREESFSKLIPGIGFFISGNTVFIDAKTKEETAIVLNSIAPTNKNVENRSGGWVFEYPYDITLNGGNHCEFNCIVNYEFNEHKIRLQFNADIIKEFSRKENRSVSDTEYHYYGGVSMEKIRNMRIPYNTFKTGKVQKWHGSHVTCLDVDVAKSIINFLKSE